MRNNELTLKEAIKALVNSYRLAPKLNEARIISSWSKLMGTTVSSRTREIYVRDKKLFLRLSSSALREELSYSKTKIIALVNEEVGEDFIQEVVLL